MRRTSLFLLPAIVLIALELLFFAPVPARATVLFAGGEDVDFVFTGTVAVSTSSSDFRSGYARLALDANALGGDPATNRFTTPNFGTQNILWIHAETRSGSGITTSGYQGIALIGSDGVQRLLVRGTGTSGQVKISKRTSAGVFTDLVTCTSGAWPTISLTSLDWFTNYSTTGETTLYVGGVQICDFVGDVTTDGITSVIQSYFSSPGNGTGDPHWSEIIVSTTDTRSLNLMTCYPAANGTNMTWTGSFANVNGTTANDATPLTTTASGQTAEFTCPSLPAGSFSVPAVTQTARLLKGAGGPQNFRFIARPSSGSTDYDNGSDVPLTTNFANYQNIWATNPACSCEWTTNDLGAGVNFGVISKP